MSKKNIIINGATGNMGQEAQKAIHNDPNLNLIDCADKDDNLNNILNKHHSDIVVDLTHPSCVYKNVKTILENGNHAVVGTTGLSEKEYTELGNLASSKQLTLIICPNFAITAILMMHFSKQAAKFMQRCEIIEYHHDKKADAPSGTAIKTAELIHESAPTINNEKLNEQELRIGARGASEKNIPIHAVRIPGVIANQEVIFGNLGQSLTIRHDTISREAFMPGLLLAIKSCGKYEGLIYGLENLLDLK